MSKDHSGRSRFLGFFSGLLAFVLSAGLGVAFLGVVVKTHDLFASPTCPMPAVVGTWQGQRQDLPAVTITIGREGDQLIGTVFFQSAQEAGARQVPAMSTVRLKDARFDGKTLRFKLDDGPGARELRDAGIEMTLTSVDHAQLRLAACTYANGAKCEEVAMTKTA